MKNPLHIAAIMLATIVLPCLLIGEAADGSTLMQAKVSSSLQTTAAFSQEDIDVVVFLNDSGSDRLGKSAAMFDSPRRAAAHQLLVSELQRETAVEARFADKVDALQQSGEISSYRYFWISGAAAVTLSPAALAELAEMPEVYYIVEDAELELIAPVATSTASSDFAGSSNSIDVAGVRQLWEMGYTGHGRLVCSFDTGVDYDHPALTSGWLGNQVANSAAAWFDPYGAALPTDLKGHGTHTMGIMVGRDGADTIGVAFNARWMAASVIDRGQTLSKTISDILAAFEWAADPDGNPATVDDLPDVICNSWGIPRGLLPTCDDTFWGAIDNLEALGIVVIFACGNEGPDPGTIRNPADRSSSPANAFSIGAIDQNQPNLPVANFSSRGPSSCSNNAIKPELVAPGVDIRSAYKDGGYRLMSGTSMAAPFIAGCVALLREYNPDATVAQIKSALLQSATDLGDSGEDNSYGWGVVNLARAIEFLPKPQKPHITYQSVWLDGNNGTILDPGTTHDLIISIMNEQVAADELTGVLSTSSSSAYIMRDTCHFGNIETGADADNLAQPFIVKLDTYGSPGSPLHFRVDFYADHFGFVNSVEFELVLGQTVAAETGTISTSQLNAEVTNFGRSERYEDFDFDSDILSNFNLMIGSADGHIYDAFPGSFDWYASSELTSITAGSLRELNGSFATIDGRFSVYQSTKVDDQPATGNFLLLDYEISDELAANEEIAVGLAADFDLLGGEEIIQSDADLFFYSADYSQVVGIRPIFDNAVVNLVDGSSFKSGGVTDSEKHGLLFESSEILSGYPNDKAVAVSTGAINFDASGQRRIGFVIATGGSIAEVEAGLDAGSDLFQKPTDAEDELDGDAILPESFTLNQNFPNPFNATTRIDVELATAGEYQLTIFNSLGQVVRSYRNVAAFPGSYSHDWDGKNQSGLDVASGVYFYKLNFSGNQQTRKMVLLK